MCSSFVYCAYSKCSTIARMLLLGDCVLSKLSCVPVLCFHKRLVAYDSCQINLVLEHVG